MVMKTAGYSKQRIEKASQSDSETGVYHEPLVSALSTWAKALQTGKQAVRKGFESTKSQEGTSRQPPVESLLSIPHLDSARFNTPEFLLDMSKLGERIAVEEERGNTLQRYRGRILTPEDPSFSDRSKLFNDRGLLHDLAQATFELEKSHAVRSPLIHDEKVIFSRVKTRDWSELSESQKRRYFQLAIERAVALFILQKSNSARFSGLLENSRLVRNITTGSVKPYLLDFSPEYQRDFCLRQKDVAWSWRNMLEPGGAKKEKPEFSARDVLMRNMIGLGMLEYLLLSGKDVLNYLREFGNAMKNHPFQRTELKESHAKQRLPGVPLVGGDFLMPSPEVINYIAREHHELWRFSREISWHFPQTELHQPLRHEHKPWADLTPFVQNKDVLNAFGTAFMLAEMPDKMFRTLQDSAAPGNPHAFPLTPFAVGKPAP